MNKRVVTVFFLFSLIMGLMSLRILSIGGSEYAQGASQNNSMSITIAKGRGEIYDYKMRRLVNTQTEYIAAAKPSVLALQALKGYLSKKDYDAVSSRFSKGYPVAVSVPVSYIDCADIKVLSVKKRYTDNQLASHILGYLDGEGKGISGIEKSFNEYLSQSGSDLSVSFPVDAQRRVLNGGKIQINEGKYYSPKGVCLTIDKDIQEITEKCIDDNNINSGAAVVIDIKTGEIRAIASRPNINLNNIAQSISSQNSPFINRAITPYSVGSVFKPVVAAAALEQGISENLTYDCTGKIVIDGVTFNCHKRTGHGVFNMEQAIMESCNTYFINLSTKVETKNIISMARSMGFGSSTELADGLVSAAGNLPDLNELDSAPAVANLAFGQGGLLSTPVQIAAYMASIASGGEYRKPVLVKALVNENGDISKSYELKAPERVMSEKTANKLKKFLINTVETGSGRRGKPSNTSAGGKTATAQSGWYDGKNEIYHVWFAGFFPAETPKYAVVVMKETGNSGAIDCGPIFKSIAEGITSLGKTK